MHLGDTIFYNICSKPGLIVKMKYLYIREFQFVCASSNLCIRRKYKMISESAKTYQKWNVGEMCAPRHTESHDCHPKEVHISTNKRHERLKLYCHKAYIVKTCDLSVNLLDV